MVNFKSKISGTVLSWFFLHPDAEMYVNEIARHFGLDSGNLTRKLAELETEGLLKSRTSGKQKYYSINKSFPLYTEYKNILQKTLGIEEQIRQALKPFISVKKAFIYGSYAKNKMDEFSDIDVFIVGKQKLEDIYKAMARIEKTAQRPINVVSMSENEFHQRKKSDPLITEIFKGKTIELI